MWQIRLRIIISVKVGNMARTKNWKKLPIKQRKRKKIVQKGEKERARMIKMEKEREKNKGVQEKKRK